MNPQSDAVQVRTWLAGPLASDIAQSIERLCRADDVRHVAVMPDVHLAKQVCVGVAVATRRLIYPAAVGSDIGCGMAAIGFEADAGLLADETAAGRVLAGMCRLIPSIKHPRATVPLALPSSLQDASLTDARLEKLKDRDGRFQFGTLGRGNHFVELQADQHDRLWLMVHCGSRGIGQAITAHHVKKAADMGGRDRLVALEAESPAGQDYLADAGWAIEYARQNRLAIVAAVERLLAELFGVTATRDTLIHCDHNHVRREMHFGQACWVHRKGALATPAGEPGVIPGSMGSPSFHVIGRGNEAALCSSSHGAGRELSRGEASKKINTRRLEREMEGVWFDHRHAALLRDEAPSAYKDIRAVMRAQRELTKIERELRPLLSYKGV
ncbi:MAG TPA: RtcB family protein [Pirellulales bacterium]|jgi:tRNA-splicing ligase RtcB|nr:RtcB family protein [Pirellulales bacterium]